MSDSKKPSNTCESLVPKNSWLQISETTLFHSHFMSFKSQVCRSSEDGREMNFYVLHSKNWCNIIPVTEEGKIVLIKQYRIGIAEHTIEIPGGVVEEGDSSYLETALREMTEETGYTQVAGGKCVDLGWSYPNPAIQNNRCSSFIVGPVKKTRQQNVDPGEMIETFEVTIEEMASLLADGKIKHALIAQAFLFLFLQDALSLERLKNRLHEFSNIPSGKQQG